MENWDPELFIWPSPLNHTVLMLMISLKHQSLITFQTFLCIRITWEALKHNVGSTCRHSHITSLGWNQRILYFDKFLRYWCCWSENTLWEWLLWSNVISSKFSRHYTPERTYDLKHHGKSLGIARATYLLRSQSAYFTTSMMGLFWNDC